MKKNNILWFLLLLSDLIFGQFIEKTTYNVNPFPEIDIFIARSTAYKDSNYNATDTFHIKYTDEETDDTDNIKILIFYKNGVRKKIIAYYENGIKYCEHNYNGKYQEGISTKWFKNGQKKEIAYFEKGEFLTPIINWYRDGTLKMVSDQDYQKRSGSTITFYKSGKIDLMESSNDTNTYFKEFWENGNLKINYIPDKGKQLFTEYFPSGVLGWKGFFINEFYYQIGFWQEWYETGILKRDYYFHDSIPNQKEGTWKWFDEKGNLVKEEYYKNGEKTGEKEYVPMKKTK